MNSLRELPVRQHKLAVQAMVGTARRNYALRDIPKIISKLIMGWALEYVDREDSYHFEKLWENVQDKNDSFVENLVCLEQCPVEYVEECVRRTREILLGE